MTIAVLGLGAVGALVAARTGAVGVGTPRTVAAIAADGITLAHGDVTTVTRIAAVGRLERPVALLVVAVKAYALEDALERVAPEAVADALVLPLLNGLEHVDRLRGTLGVRAPGARVAAGSIGRLEAFSPRPGVVVERSVGATITTACRDVRAAELRTIVEPLRVPGIEVDVRDDEPAVLWEKAARLAVLAAATVASGETVGPIRSDPRWRKRLEHGLLEACDVAAADGVALDPAAQWAIIDGMPESLTTSTARDVAAGRPSELDAITGSVVRAGRRLGVPTPELERLWEDACRRR